ncbi:28S ribosomal protein S36, mitochondrial-like [Anneissia japonica]|uniref:28S ribosomal protein S36, mitochondrial-like n=1 Tax=Anneissia japonica TaxID=1529436 RepID=UPI001425B5DD|nr:28S ribosomal protein S36, mitochondrial-like [Anneissia japonica]
MMSSTGRLIAKVKPHIPMIKFRAGKSPVSLQKPLAAVTSLKSHNTSTTSSKEKGPVIEFGQLPLKFRRAQIETDEMEFIMRGGPDL